MPQHFNFISLDKREYAFGGRLTRVFGGSYYLPYMIAKPNVLPVISNTDDGTSSMEGRSQHNTLVTLPNELLMDIFDYIGLPEVLCLSFTCKRLWKFGWPYVQDGVFGTWRGTRLICEGDENPPVHLPLNMLSTHEFEEFSEGIYDYGNDQFIIHHDLGPATLFNWMRVRGKWRHCFDLSSRPLHELFDRTLCPLSESERSQALKLLVRDGFVQFFSPKQHGTLRNLTKKAFVRGKTLNVAFHSTPTTGLDLPSPDFGDVLVSQILWSKSTHSSVGLNCGDWAGDRFECVTDEDHNLSSDQSWTDESDKVIKTLAKALQRLGDSTSDEQICDECAPRRRGRKRKRIFFDPYIYD